MELSRSQQSILRFLLKQWSVPDLGGWAYRNQICSASHLGFTLVCADLDRLIKLGLVETSTPTHGVMPDAKLFRVCSDKYEQVRALLLKA